MAFLLPLLTALAGMWLFRFLFPALSERMPLLEQLACGLGLGMMAVAALTLGVKLCGFSGRGLILAVTAVGGIAEIWRDRKAFWTGISWRLPEAGSQSRCHCHFGGRAACVSDSFPSRRVAGTCRIRRGDGVVAQGEDHAPLHRKMSWCNGFPIRVWRMRILTIPRSCPRCMQPRMIRSVMWTNLSPSSGPPGCCCFFSPPWPR